MEMLYPWTFSIPSSCLLQVGLICHIECSKAPGHWSLAQEPSFGLFALISITEHTCTSVTNQTCVCPRPCGVG